jgi:hypothetical protein
MLGHFSGSALPVLNSGFLRCIVGRAGFVNNAKTAEGYSVDVKIGF